MEQEISFVTSFDGTRLGCASAGIGPPLVKAPNWLSHLTADWEGPVWSHWWRELTVSHRLIRFDQRGCGLSDRAVADLSFEAWVRDLESVVEAMGLTRFPLFGMSQGAAVAVEFAVRNPEKVSSLFLYGGIARGWAKSGHPAEANEALATLIRSGWESDNPAFRQVFTSQFMPDATKEQMDSFNELSRLSTSAQNAVRFQYEVGQIDIISRLAQVRCPTIVCHCRHDARVPFAQGQQIAALIPGATLVPLEGRNHIILEDEVVWSDFVQELRGFTGSASSAEGPGTTMEPPLARASGTQAAESAKLSPREIEVLRLIVLGRSDREIASELVLSVKTVGNHVGSILTKTDTPNRTAAAFYATRHGII